MAAPPGAPPKGKANPHATFLTNDHHQKLCDYFTLYDQHSMNTHLRINKFTIGSPPDPHSAYEWLAMRDYVQSLFPLYVWRALLS